MTGYRPPGRDNLAFGAGGSPRRQIPALRGHQQDGAQRERDYWRNEYYEGYASTGPAAASAAQATTHLRSATPAAPLKEGDTGMQHDTSKATAPGIMVSQPATGKQDKQIVKSSPRGGTAFEDGVDDYEYRWQYRNSTYEYSDYGYNYDDDYDEDYDDDDEDNDLDPIERLRRMQSRAPPPQERGPPTSFDRIGELRRLRQESAHRRGEGYAQPTRRTRKRVRTKRDPKYANRHTAMAAGKPGAERLAEGEPAVKRQRTGEPPLSSGAIAYGDQEDMIVDQQAPSVGEEGQLFAMNEQATQERPRVTVRLPPYIVVEQQAPSVEEENELFIEDEQIMQGRLKVTVRLPRSW